MESSVPSPGAPSHPWRWFPEFFELRRQRFPTQARLMSLSLFVGLVAGLEGIICLEDVHLVARDASLGALILAADLLRPNVTPLTQDCRLDRAMELFVDQEVMVLPVVESAKNRKVVGIVRRSDVAHAYLDKVHGQPV